MSGITMVFIGYKNQWCHRKKKLFWKSSLWAKISATSCAVARLWSHALSCSLSVENVCRMISVSEMFMQQCCRVVTPHDLPARPRCKQKLECVGHGWGGKSRLHFMSGLISWAVASHYKMARDGSGCTQTAEDPWGCSSWAFGEGQGWAVDSLWVSSALVFYISGVCNGFSTVLAVSAVGSDYTGLVRWGTSEQSPVLPQSDRGRCLVKWAELMPDQWFTESVERMGGRVKVIIVGVWLSLPMEGHSEEEGFLEPCLFCDVF